MGNCSNNKTLRPSSFANKHSVHCLALAFESKPEFCCLLAALRKLNRVSRFWSYEIHAGHAVVRKRPELAIWVLQPRSGGCGSFPAPVVLLFCSGCSELFSLGTKSPMFTQGTKVGPEKFESPLRHLSVLHPSICVSAGGTSLIRDQQFCELLSLPSPEDCASWHHWPPDGEGALAYKPGPPNWLSLGACSCSLP